MRQHKRALQQFVNKRKVAHARYLERMREVEVTKAILGEHTQEVEDAVHLAWRAWAKVMEAERMVGEIVRAQKRIR